MPIAGPALVTRRTAEQLGLAAAGTAGGNRALVALADGSDCVLPVVVAEEGVADGQIAVTPVQQYNLHLGAGISDEFRCAGQGGLVGVEGRSGVDFAPCYSSGCCRMCMHTEAVSRPVGT